MESSNSIVKGTLKSKHIFLTGCTGFLGKVLLEKIIRSSPDVAGIHILIRGNARYPSAIERAEQEVLGSSVFNHLKSLNESFFNEFCAQKIHIVNGQLTEKNFGLDAPTFEKLAQEIDVIVNSAASVDFREPLDQALNINTLALNNIVALSKKGKRTPVVQVSTCYVNGFHTGDIYEETYGPKFKKIPRNEKGHYLVEGMIYTLQEKIARVKRPAATRQENRAALVELGIEQANRFGWNDTYTFTKWLGEQLLIQKLDNSPLVILRPAIIESTLKAPVPGWIEGIKVADAIVFAYARGKIAFFPANPHAAMDIIPADLVANAGVLSIVKALRSNTETNIYQCCSTGSNPVTVAELKRAMVDEAQTNYKAYPKLFKMKKPSKDFTFVSRSVFDASIKAAQLPLGIFHDIKSKIGLSSQKHPMHKNIDTARTLSTTFGFYGFPKYTFHNGKLLGLAKELGETAKGEFPVDAKLINWRNYFGKSHLSGLERYAINEDAKTTLVKTAKVKEVETLD